MFCFKTYDVNIYASTSYWNGPELDVLLTDTQHEEHFFHDDHEELTIEPF